LPFRGPRLRSNARSLPSPDQRTAGGRSVQSDATGQATLRAKGCATDAPEAERSPEFAAGLQAGARLGGTLLRFQRVDRTQAGGETAIYASQSGETRPGDRAAAVGLGQFPGLPF